MAAELEMADKIVVDTAHPRLASAEVREVAAVLLGGFQ